MRTLLNHAFLLLSITSIAAPASANRTSLSFEGALDRLSAGAPTLALFEAGQCTADHSNAPQIAPPGTYGGFVIKSFMQVPGRALAFSNDQLAVTPDGTVRIELIVYHVQPTGQSTIDIHFLSPSNYTDLAPTRHYSCDLGHGLYLLPAKT